MKLTDAQVRNLKPQAQRYEFWEGKTGFGVRVTPRGKKSFVYMYRYEGKARRLTIGNYPAMTLAEAHKQYAEAKEKLEKGIDPGTETVAQRVAERKAPTMSDLVQEFLDRCAKAGKPRRALPVYKRILEKDVLPEWGPRKAKDIVKRDVIKLLDGIVDRGAPIMANRTLAVVRRMFNFAVEREILTVSPCIKVKAPAKENQRDRVLTTEEIRAFWHGLDSMEGVNESIKLALKLELATGQRKGEVVSAAWEEIDLEECIWTIPGEMTPLRLARRVNDGLAKNGLPHRIPLSPLAIEILQAAKGMAGDSPWVFPSHRTDKPITPPAVDHALRRPDLEALGFTFVPHDLRRTAASQMTGMGIPRLVVSKILNHVERGVTAVYDRHSYDGEKRQALEKWGRKLKSLIGLEEGKVISLGKLP